MASDRAIWDVEGAREFSSTGQQYVLNGDNTYICDESWSWMIDLEND